MTVGDGTDVFFYEAFAEEAAALRARLPDDVRADFTWRAAQECPAAATPPARLVSIRTQSVLPVAWAGALGGILTRSTGYDHVTAYRLAAGREVPAGYLPLYCHRAVAEQAALLWLALLRRLPRQIAQFRTFSRDHLTGGECRGRTVAIVGVGNIGGETARIAAGLDMRVIGVDPVRRHTSVSYASYAAAAPLADVVVCAMNLTADNRGYFDAARLGLLRPGAIFVNVARGELAPPAALLAALESGRLGGVGLDVHDEEAALAVGLRAGALDAAADRPAPTPSIAATLALARHPQAILLPHNAFNTAESVERKAQQSVAAAVAFLATGHFPHPVPPGLTRAATGN